LGGCLVKEVGRDPSGNRKMTEKGEKHISLGRKEGGEVQ